ARLADMSSFTDFHVAPPRSRTWTSSGGAGSGNSSSGASGSDIAVVPVELELRDLRLVGEPFRPLVLDEPLEDVLAQRLGDELGRLHHVERLGQRSGEGFDAFGEPFLFGQLVQVG